MRLEDINPRYKTTEEAEPPNDLVKVPGMGLVHVGGLQQNILRKLKDLVEKVECDGSHAIIEAHRLMHTPAFNAMFDALAAAHEARLRKRK